VASHPAFVAIEAVEAIEERHADPEWGQAIRPVDAVAGARGLSSVYPSFPCPSGPYPSGSCREEGQGWVWAVGAWIEAWTDWLRPMTKHG